MNYPHIKLPLEYISNLRNIINDNSYIMLHNSPKQHNWGLICVCLERVEDIARYLNAKVLGERHDYGCAFDLMEFLSHSATMIDCINHLITIFDAWDSVKTPQVFFGNKEITDKQELNNRLSKTKGQKNEDDLYYEYIRSIGVIHPNDTSRHPYFQHYALEASPFLIWSTLATLTGEGDIAIHVYNANNSSGLISLHLKLEDIYSYVLDRYNRIVLITELVQKHINNILSTLRRQKIQTSRSFKNYNDYLEYLEKEAERRHDDIALSIKDSAKMLNLDGIPQTIRPQYRLYCNALKFAINETRRLLQGPLLSPRFDGKVLIRELDLPVPVRQDKPDYIYYCREKAAKLYNSNLYSKEDIKWARTQAKRLYRIVKQYCPVNGNILDKIDNLSLLATVNTALYLYSLDRDSYINRTIPKTLRFRVKI